MEYKTTYFQISLNNEISINSSDYFNKIDNSELLNSISETIHLINKNSSIKIEFDNLDILKLEKFKNDVYKAYGIPSTYDDPIIRKLTDLITKLQNLTNRRFTEKHEEELSVHLNKNAKDGWKLFSMNPIIKGYKEKNRDFGLGHDVTEGFVLVWEK